MFSEFQGNFSWTFPSFKLFLSLAVGGGSCPRLICGSADTLILQQLGVSCPLALEAEHTLTGGISRKVDSEVGWGVSPPVNSAPHCLGLFLGREETRSLVALACTQLVIHFCAWQG